MTSIFNSKVTLSIKTLLIGVIAIVGLLVVSYVGLALQRKDLLAEYNKKYEAYQATAVRPALKQSDSLSRVNLILSTRIDSTVKRVAKQTTEIKRLSTVLSALHTTNDSLEANLDSLPEECDGVLALVEGLKEERDTLYKQRDTLQVQVDEKESIIVDTKSQLLNMTIDRDTLMSTIIKWPAPPKPKKFFNLFPHIKPETAFWTGVVLTAASAVYINNKP